MSRWKKLGAKPADIPYIKHFAAAFAAQGWSDAEIDKAVKFGLDNQHQGWDRFEALAIREAGKIGLDDAALDAALNVGDQILSLPQLRERLETDAFVEEHLSARPQATDRLAEIQRLMASDPDKYWQDPAMQAEFARLVEAREAGASAPAAPNPRRAEIERMMAQTPDAYWGNPEIQNEFAAIVAAETPAQEAAE